MYLNFKIRSKNLQSIQKYNAIFLQITIHTHIHVSINEIPVRRYTDKLLCMYT